MGTVVVLGSFMMDLVARAPHRPAPGETVVGSDFYTSEGGKGFNQAVAATRAGATTAMIGALGDDEYGRSFRAFLDRENIDSRGVLTADEGTGVGLPVVDDDGGNSIVVVRRANEAVTPQIVGDALDALDDVKVVVMQLELAIENAIAAARWGREHGAIVLLNPAPMCAIPEELIECTDVLTPNEVELAELSRQFFGNGVSARESSIRLTEAYGLTVVATMGSQGALVVEPGADPVQVAAPMVRAVDTVGAGDTFCGYLAAGLARGQSIASVAPAACAAASLSVTRLGSAVSVPYRYELPTEVALDERAPTGDVDVLESQGKETR